MTAASFRRAAMCCGFEPAILQKRQRLGHPTSATISILRSSQAKPGHASMRKAGWSATGAGMICPALSLAFVLLTTELRGQSAPDATCTGKTDVPWTEQIKGCTKAIESGRYAGKDLADALILRGKAYAQTGDIGRCLADIEQAIRVDPTNAVALAARGEVHLANKEYQRALADLTDAASLDPGNALILVGRGMAHIATGDPDRAMADFEQAIRLQPALAAGLYWRGVARRLKGDVEAGEADIAAAKKIDPEVGD
jgi:tetratricopeptide (TPR) repeat protein